MNFLKKKLKPLTSGLTNNAAHNKNDKTNKDLEDDLYDEYVVEAPPHPSELLALGVDPTDIDVNDPKKLKELYRKAKEEGKDKKTNSTLLARLRQKEEIEEKKKTTEEWKFFDSMTARVEQAVKVSQKTLEQLKESSAIEELAKPDYELRLAPSQVSNSSAAVESEESSHKPPIPSSEKSTNPEKKVEPKPDIQVFFDDLDEFGCPKKEFVQESSAPNFIVEELLQDFGLDLRSAEQKKVEPEKKSNTSCSEPCSSKAQPKPNINLKASARPRPRPNPNASGIDTSDKAESDDVDPFDTSFVAETPIEVEVLLSEEFDKNLPSQTSQVTADPFDTSFVNL